MVETVVLKQYDNKYTTALSKKMEGMILFCIPLFSK